MTFVYSNSCTQSYCDGMNIAPPSISEDIDNFKLTLGNLNSKYGYTKIEYSKGDNEQEADTGHRAEKVETCDFFGGMGGSFLGTLALVAIGLSTDGLGIFIGVIYTGITGGLGSALGSICAADATTQDCSGYARPTYVISSENNSVEIKLSNYANGNLAMDSIGYKHNIVMKEMLSSGLKLPYDRPLIGSDLEKHYDMCLKHINSLYSEEERIDLDIEYKELLLQLIANITNEYRKFLSGDITFDSFISNVKIMFVEKYGMPKEVEDYIDISVAISNTCENLTLDEIKSYAKDLNTLIHNDRYLSREAKSIIAFQAQITVNSNLCWKKKIYLNADDQI